MTQINIALAIIGALVLGVGIVSQAMKRTWIEEPLVAVVLGIAVGPYGLAWLDIAKWGDPMKLLEEAARLTLAIGLMGIALRLTRRDLLRLWRPVTILLTGGMLGMWVLSSALAGWLLGVSLLSAILIGAAITPTDPIVASSIVTGPVAEKHLPERVRGSLSLEAGANDGLAYLLVMLPILLITLRPEEAWRKFLLETVVLGILAAAAVGAVIGLVAARVLHWAERHRSIEDYSFLTYTVALSLFTLGTASLIGADALISVFAAGLAFSVAAKRSEKHKEESVQEAINKLFSLPIFVMVGLALPWEQWAAIGWPIPVTAVLILALRRMPVLAALFPMLRGTYTGQDCTYLGWFGPIGVAAVYYAALGVRHTGNETVWSVVSAVVFASILAHSVTATPLARRYSTTEPHAAPRNGDRSSGEEPIR